MSLLVATRTCAHKCCRASNHKSSHLSRRSAFKKFSAWPTHSGLSDFAKWDVVGEEVLREHHDFPWCLVLQPLLRPDGSGPAAGAGERRFEQEVEAKMQGSGFKRVWAVLQEGNKTLCTYASQADAAAAADNAADNWKEDEDHFSAIGRPETVLPVVQVQNSIRVQPPQKYQGQHVIGLQPQQSPVTTQSTTEGQHREKQTGKQLQQEELSPPLFFRFATMEDCERWSAAIGRILASDSSATGLSSASRDDGADDKESSASAQTATTATTLESDRSAGFLQQLSQIPPGTALYEVFACPSPKCATRMMQTQDPASASLQNTAGEEKEPFLLKVGIIRSASHFVRSRHRLAFRHQRKEEDYARKPQWIDELDRGGGLHLTIGHKAFEANIRAGRYAECS